MLMPIFKLHPFKSLLRIIESNNLPFESFFNCHFIDTL